MVKIHNLYIFDRHCQCIFYSEWNRPSSPLTADTTTLQRFSEDSTSHQPQPQQRQQRPIVWPTDPSSTAHRVSPDSPAHRAMEEEAKLVYGVVFSTRNIVNKLSGHNTSGNPGGFLSFATNSYRLHYYESPSGVKFVLNTDVESTSMQPVLEMIYRNIYVEYVVKNPLFRMDPNRSAPIENDYFRAVLNNYLKEISTLS